MGNLQYIFNDWLVARHSLLSLFEFLFPVLSLIIFLKLAVISKYLLIDWLVQYRLVKYILDSTWSFSSTSTTNLPWEFNFSFCCRHTVFHTEAPAYSSFPTSLLYWAHTSITWIRLIFCLNITIYTQLFHMLCLPKVFQSLLISTWMFAWCYNFGLNAKRNLYVQTLHKTHVTNIWMCTKRCLHGEEQYQNKIIMN